MTLVATTYTESNGATRWCGTIRYKMCKSQSVTRARAASSSSFLVVCATVPGVRVSSSLRVNDVSKDHRDC